MSFSNEDIFQTQEFSEAQFFGSLLVLKRDYTYLCDKACEQKEIETIENRNTQLGFSKL